MTNPFILGADNYNPFEHDDEPLKDPEMNNNQVQKQENNSISQEVTNNQNVSEPKEPETKKTDTNTTKKSDSIISQTINLMKNTKNGYKDPATGIYITEEEMTRKEQELAKREALIAKREQEIEEAKANGTYDQLNTHKRNFPIYLNWYAYYPDEDLPEDSLPIVKQKMILIYVGSILLILNFIGCLIILFWAGSAVKSPAASIVFSLLFIFVGIPLLFELSFFTLYNALKLQKSLKFIGFLVADGIFIIFMFLLALGFLDYGSIGFIVSIDCLSKVSNKFAGVYCIIWSICIAAYIVITSLLWIREYRYFTNLNSSKNLQFLHLNMQIHLTSVNMSKTIFHL
ncbi:hypothetical protein TVAG_034430 [Trichomonas vaginalis G3]|uniref:Secretory carrier membrane protein n=1 Tax=Trichomonas vaginalis (strain ATCC PRA-98 / G3) TaxID=412133 RepID=A2EM80_TRIV3|nr:protein transport [Trichomonas vaginalis G3]EAY06264.1 hypothetical protein TVAG_034430 [Trichomonas vaginalis G3]KAI5505146.1 protein transport [Trichomonas vaginalis G3]|eukprot:XP_001318487.1 hypothetical protein [Trichomonas vaginalis G3]